MKLLVIFLLAVLVPTNHGLKCYQCDGGSGTCEENEKPKAVNCVKGFCVKLDEIGPGFHMRAIRCKPDLRLEGEDDKVDYTRGCKPGRTDGNPCRCETDLCNGL